MNVTDKSKKTKKLMRATFTDVVIAAFLGVLAFIVIYPFYNAVLISLVSENEYVRTPFLMFPKKFVFDSYKTIIEQGTLFLGMRTTTLVTFFGVTYNMLLTVFCSYALTKEFPGKRAVLYLIIFTMYFSGGLIPYYLLIKDLHLMDNIFSMILPMGITFSYMTVIRRHFESIPPSLIESAKIDGANEIAILFRIVLPLSTPILATYVLYYGVDRWNEWWNGMLFIKSYEKQPLQLILRTIVMDVSTANASASSATGIIPFGEGIKMASTVVSMLPIMCVYPFLQKYFVAGLTVGAVKE